VPWLSVREIRDVRWSLSGAVDHAVDLPLHPLAEDERLIGYAGADPDALASLFAGQTLVWVPLDLTRPLAGPIEAWEALDGVVLDAAAAGRVDESQLRGLLAAGTAVAIKSDRRPGGPWPWQKQGAYFVLHIPISGPQSVFVPEGAYAPTQVWLRGWPAPFRRHIILAAVLFTILATALTLWRSRWMALSVLALCALSAGAILEWRAHQHVQLEAGGSVIVLNESTTQYDDWTYRAVLRPADGIVAWHPSVRPILAYPRQPADSDLRLICAADGQPLEFRYRQEPGKSLAFLTRALRAERPAVMPMLPVSSPLRTLTDTLYAGPGDRIVGQLVEDGENRWPAVVVEKAHNPPARLSQ
ncbi:MAG: hypothetical protein JWO87_907, partial [Phycisphaerales bacterium]|nr:hypothetical protein [Phycisphaerales bacterium]